MSAPEVLILSGTCPWILCRCWQKSCLQHASNPPPPDSSGLSASPLHLWPYFQMFTPWLLASAHSFWFLSRYPLFFRVSCRSFSQAKTVLSDVPEPVEPPIPPDPPDQLSPFHFPSSQLLIASLSPLSIVVWGLSIFCDLLRINPSP